MARQSESSNGRQVVFLAPNASRTGAPIALLHLLRWLKTHTDLSFRIILFQDGPLAVDFSALAPTVTLTEVGVGRSSLVRKIGKLPVIGQVLKRLWHQAVGPRALGPQPGIIYANSVASARLIRQIVPAGAPLIVHVHELEQVIQTVAGRAGMAAIKALAWRYVAMSSPVRQNLLANHGIEPALIEFIPSFIRVDELVAQRSERYRSAMRRSLEIPEDAAVVMGCGATDWRKGVDLFVGDGGPGSRENDWLPGAFCMGG